MSTQGGATYSISTIQLPLWPALACSPIEIEGRTEEGANRVPGERHSWDMTSDITLFRIRPATVLAAIASHCPTLDDDALFELDAEWAGCYLDARHRGCQSVAACARAVLAVLGTESDRRAMGRVGRRAA